MRILLDKNNWSLFEKKTGISNFLEFENKTLQISNTTNEYLEFNYENIIEIKDKSLTQLEISIENFQCIKGGGCLYINGHGVPLESKALMPIIPPVKLEIKLKVMADTKCFLDNIILECSNKNSDLADNLVKDSDVLVVTPGYPSSENLYTCGFVHSRVKEYQNSGLNVQVAVIGNNWYQTSYKLDGIDVFKGAYVNLKSILSKKQFKTIVVHFVDEHLLQIFDGYIDNEQLVFICHGPETLFNYLPNKVRPYFTAEIDERICKVNNEKKEYYIKKYSKYNNVHWVFVSDWLKEFSEEQLNIKFKNTSIIHNVINENLFPYKIKTEELRKNILIVRKFDNICQHSIDQSVLAILELSRRDFFKELNINIYGDGDYFNELLLPLRQFKNVNIVRKFIKNDQLYKIFHENGIALLPSRHDSQGVAMCESAASGLVVVGSRVTTVPLFMNEEMNHTLADPENPTELADIIERLYRKPDEFLRISERMSKDVISRCCIKNTVGREIELIKKLSKAKNKLFQETLIKDLILTIIVPSYNIEQYIEKCLYSLINHDMNAYLEIIVINDGSTDNTLKKIENFIIKYKTNNIRIINKENGGHGSTINVGIKEAKGKYFRLIDGDDWVDSENLSKQIKLLANTDVDLMLTKGCYEYVERAGLENIINYDFLHEGTIYNFDDLTYKGYGFSDYGPLLTTSTYKTEVLRKAKFKISEKKPYVDMEFNAFSLQYVNKVVYYDLDIYRYLIGREGQTISRDFWKKKYKAHEHILFNLCNYVMEDKILSSRKKKYISEKLIARMVDSQIFMYDQVVNWEGLEIFLKELKSYSTIYSISMKYIKEKAHDSDIILKYFSNAIKKNKHIKLEKRDPIINLDDSINLKYKEKNLFMNYSKKIAKWIVPHEVAIRISKKLH